MKDPLSFIILFFVISVKLGFAQQPRLVLPFGHTSIINDVAVSDDFERVLSVSEDKLIKLWDIRLGRQLISLQDHNSNVLKGFFISKSKDFITASENGEVKIWNSNAILQRTIHTELEEVNVKNTNLSDFVLTENGQEFIVGSEDGIVTIWKVKNGELRYKINAFNVAVNKIILNPNSTKIIVIPVEGNPHVFSLISGEKLGELKDHNGQIKTAAFSPTGDYIATGGIQNEVVIYSSYDFTIVNRLVGHERVFRGNDKEEITLFINNQFWIHDLQFNFEGNRLITASDDGTAIVWNIKEGKILQRFYHFGGQIKSCNFNRDGKSVLTSSAKDTKVWEVDTGIELAKLEGSDGTFIDEGKHIRTSTSIFNKSQNINEFIFWDADNYDIYKSFIQISDEINEILDANEDTKIVISQMRGGIRIWDATKGTITNPNSDSAQHIVSYCQDLNGNYLVFCKDDSEIVLYDIKKLREITRYKSETGDSIEMKIDNSGEFLSLIFSDGYLEIRKISNLSLLYHFKFKNNIASAEFTSSKAGLLVALREGDIFWISLTDYKIINTWNTGFNDSYGANISNNGKYLLSYGSEGYKIQDITQSLKTIIKDDSTAFYKGHFSDNNLFALIGNHIVSVEKKSTIKLPYFMKAYPDPTWEYFVYTTNEMFNDSILVHERQRKISSAEQRYIHNSTVTDIKFNRDGNSFYSVSADNSMKKW
ncbi:MAG: WD40 repeat domain-containing protein, partial [Sediminibacterium sp.]